MGKKKEGKKEVGKKKEERQEEDHGSGQRPVTLAVSLEANHWMLLDVSSSQVRAEANVYHQLDEVKLKGNPIGRFI